MFGVRLPLNFNSPYKAVDVIDFWRRWHMTLSRFLRDYLYIPLGGNRLGRSRQLVNVMIVMLLGGLWHGAGWTFVVWGGLHGIFLVGNHVWRTARGARDGLPAWRRAISCAVTFFFVTIARVFFRATDIPTAFSIVKSMIGAGAPAAATLADLPGLAKIVALLVIVWSFPNTQEFMGRVEPALGYDPAQRPWAMAAWQPNWLTASMSASLAVWALGTMLYSSRIAEFIYFQF